MEKPVTRISVRNLVEFILRSGDLDSRRGTMDKEAMLKGSRLHRKLQKQMDGDYRAEVALKRESSYEDLSIQVEGRADGIFTEEETTWIDEIKGIYGNVEKLEQPVAVHKAQAMCYGYIVAMEENLSSIGIQMTYANLDTEEIKRFREVFSIEDLSDWYQKLLDEYHKWLSYSLKWKKERNESLQNRISVPVQGRPAENGGKRLPFHQRWQADLHPGSYRRWKNYVHYFPGCPRCGRGKRGDHFLPYCQDHYQNCGGGGFCGSSGKRHEIQGGDHHGQG